MEAQLECFVDDVPNRPSRNMQEMVLISKYFDKNAE